MLKFVFAAMFAIAGVVAAPRHAQAADTAARAAPKVEMYALKDCGYCARARSYFASRGVAWQEYDIEADPAAAQRFKELGGVGTPLIFIDDTRIAGFDLARIEQALAP